jgi:hypothetical protein
MSKRNRRKFELGQAQNNNFQSPAPQKAMSQSEQHAAEYKIIRSDLIRVVIVNALFLAAVLVLYFTNRNSNYLERFYQNLF